MTTSV